jgi:hypothetical protein
MPWLLGGEHGQSVLDKVAQKLGFRALAATLCKFDPDTATLPAASLWVRPTALMVYAAGFIWAILAAITNRSLCDLSVQIKTTSAFFGPMGPPKRRIPCHAHPPVHATPIDAIQTSLRLRRPGGGTFKGHVRPTFTFGLHMGLDVDAFTAVRPARSSG